ncbi:extracellular solute-binding protein [Bermanella sp. R86510]|uniref:extracellular solute-binding protein n=1 Tax=unclassified Bermanella TaxID=2627862 RepID=UPI0037CADC05
MRLGLVLLLTFSSALSWAESQTVNVFSFRQPFLIEPILESFTEKTGIETRVIFAKKGLIQRIKQQGELSPADVVLTSNFSKLLQLKDEGLTQPFALEGVKESIPSQFRDDQQRWLALTKRVRNVYSSKDRLGPLDIDYEDLAQPRFKGKICTRSGKHPYNLGLIASLIVHNGEAATKQWLEGVKANLARKPQGNDRAQVKAIKEGLCDVSLGNSYYLGKMLQDENQLAWANAVHLNFPNQANRGSHINVSGAAIAKYAPNPKAAQALLEFLASQEAQSLYAKLNMEYPVNPNVQASELVKSWGEFKEDDVSLTRLANEIKTALKLVDEVKFDL